jgi:hypothetical protein
MWGEREVERGSLGNRERWRGLMKLERNHGDETLGVLRKCVTVRH